MDFFNQNFNFVTKFTIFPLFQKLEFLGSYMFHRSSTLSFMNRSARVLKVKKSKIIHRTQIMEIQHNHKARIMESR